MGKKFTAVFLLSVLFLPGLVFAQSNQLEPPGEAGTISREEFFYRGQVLEIIKDEVRDAGGSPYRTQVVKVKILSGDDKDQEIEINNEGVTTPGVFVTVGETVVIYKTFVQGEPVYYIAEQISTAGFGNCSGRIFCHSHNICQVERTDLYFRVSRYCDCYC